MFPPDVACLPDIANQAAAPACEASLCLPFHRPPADVVPVESFGPADAGDSLVGARARLAHGAPERRNVEHASAIGKDASALRFGAGMENLHARDGGGGVKAVDDRAFGVRAGIAPGGHNHGERGLTIPAQIERLSTPSRL